MTVPARDPWILRHPRAPRPGSGATLRVFCFPMAGSGACMYHPWHKRLPETIDVAPIEYPGVNSRMREPRASSLATLADQAAAAVRRAIESEGGSAPYVLFGHSLGAWIAHEVARRLAVDGLGPAPAALFVSAIRSPTLAGVEHDPDGCEMHKLEGDAFWEAYERRYGINADLSHPALRARLIGSMKSDFYLSETYRMGSLPAVTFPTFVLGGTEDPRYSKDQLETWRDAVDGEMSVRWFPGGHMYVRDQEEPVTTYVLDSVAGLA